MGNLTLATDIGGVFREVTDFPAGTANDGGITGVTINGKKALRQKKGVHLAEEVGLFANGLDMTARLNAVLGHVKIKTLKIHIDGGGVILINGTVTVPAGKILDFVEGTTLGGTGTITGFKLRADDTTQCVADGSTLTFTPATFSRPRISPAWWGFKPNTGADMSAPLQKAINVAVQNATVKLVSIAQGGTYIVKDIYVMKNPGSANGGQTSCSIVGAAQSSAQGVTFKTTDLNAATIHFQQVLGCLIERITFDGPLATYTANAVTGDWAQGARTNTITPSCAAAIDDMYRGSGSTITDSNMYPGLYAPVYANTQYNGSTNITFRDCNFFNHYVGIANGLSGCPNGEGIHLTGGNSHNVAFFWAAGQLQSRENVIDNHYFYNGDTFITNVGFGVGTGDLPSVNNCNINVCKYLFQAAAGDFTFVRFSNLYAEAIWSLGKSALNTSVSFTEAQVTMMAPTYYSAGITAPSPVWVETAGPFKWDGGKIEGVAYSSPFPINCKLASFTDCFIRGGVVFQTNPANFDDIKFKNVSYNNGGANNILTDSFRNDVQMTAGVDQAYYSGRFFIPGNSFTGRDHRTMIASGQKIERLAVGTYAVTVNAADRTCFFTPDSTGRFTVSDTIIFDESVNWASDVYSATPSTLGYVSGFGGSAVICSHVPAGVVSGTYTLYVARYPKFKGRGLGTTTSGSAVISNVVYEVASFILAGTRIKGDGIPVGAYVVSYASGNLTISMNCTATANVVELCDAPYQVTSDNRTFSYFGAPITYTSLAAIWFKGDEVMNLTGVADVRSWFVLKAGKQGDVARPITFWPGKYSMDAMQFTNDHTLLLNNMYYDFTTSNWRYKNTTTSGSSALQFQEGKLVFLSAPAGVGAATLTVLNALFTVNADGTVVVTASLSGITEGTSENSVKMASTAWVRIFADGKFVRLAGAYQTVAAQTQINALVVQQLKGNGPAPAVSFGTGAGTGATGSIPLGHSVCFELSFASGTSPAAAGSVIATVTLYEAVGGDNPRVSYAPRNAVTAQTPFYFETNSHQNVVVKAAVALSASTNYDMDITVIDY